MDTLTALWEMISRLADLANLFLVKLLPLIVVVCLVLIVRRLSGIRRAMGDLTREIRNQRQSPAAAELLAAADED